MTTRKRKMTQSLMRTGKQHKSQESKKAKEIKDAIKQDRERDMTQFGWPTHEQWAEDVAAQVDKFLADFPFEAKDAKNDFFKGSWRILSSASEVTEQDEYICPIGWRYPISDRGCRSFGRLEHKSGKTNIVRQEAGNTTVESLDNCKDVIGKRTKTFIGHFLCGNDSSVCDIEVYAQGKPLNSRFDFRFFFETKFFLNQVQAK